MDLFEIGLTDVFVGNTNVAGATTIAAMPNSSVALQNADGGLNTGTLVATGSSVRFVSKNAAGQVSVGAYFKPEDIQTKSTKLYVAPTEQVTVIGYDGTSGALDAVANQEFFLNIGLGYTQRNINNTNVIKTVPAFTVAASGKELQLSLLDSFNSVFGQNRLASGHIIIERIADGTYLGAVTGVTGVEGSNTITKTAHGVAVTVGNAIRLNTGTPVSTSPVYYIVGGTVDSLILDRPITVSGATLQIAAASVQPTNFGVKLSGKELNPWNPQTDANNKVYFSVGFVRAKGDAATAPVKTLTAMTYGSGSYRAVSNSEFYGFMNRRGSAPTTFDYASAAVVREAVPGNTYAITDIYVVKRPAMFIGTGQTPAVNNRIVIAHKSATDTIATINTAFGLTSV